MRRVIKPAAILIVGALLAGCDSAEDRAQAHLDRGTEFLAAGEPIKARLELRNAIKLDENSAEAYFALGQVEEKLGHYQTAAQVYANLADRFADHVEARLRLAVILSTAGSPEDARIYAAEAYKLRPDDVNVLVAMAATALKLGDRPEAARFLDMALTREPANPDALTILASERLEAGAPTEALDLIERGLRDNETNLGLQYLKVKALDSLGDHRGGEAVLTRLIELYPSEGPFRTGLAQWYIGQGRVDDAEALLREHVTLHPDDVDGQLELVTFLKSQRGLDAAMAEAEPLARDAEDPFPYEMALAELLVEQGEHEKARSLLTDVAELADTADRERQARIQLARVLGSQARWSEAGAEVDLVIEDDPKNVDALELRAQIALATNEVDTAIDALQTALNEAPGSVPLLLLLADSLELAGSVDLAEETYARAVRANETNGDASRRMAVFLLRYGKTDQAERVLEDALQAGLDERETHLVLARLKLDRRDYEGALRQTLGSVGDLDDPEVMGVRALALVGLGRFASAQAIVDAMPAAEEPDMGRLKLQVGILVAGGHVDDAVDLLHRRFELAERKGEIGVLLGSMIETYRDPVEAEEIYRQAAGLDASAQTALIGFLLRHDRAAEAVVLARAAVDAAGGDGDLRLHLALALENAGRLEEAIAEYEVLFAEDPRSSIVANNLAAGLARLDDDPDVLDRAHAIAVRFRSSEIPEYADTLGWIEFARGNVEEALPLLRMAAERLPRNAEVQRHFGLALEEVGQVERAREVLRRASELAAPGLSGAHQSREATEVAPAGAPASPTKVVESEFAPSPATDNRKVQ